jgi:uncharacterized RDD family membrane protein YckC
MRLRTVFIEETEDSMELEYVGFWLRLWAGIVDVLLLAVILVPLALIVFGWNDLATVIHIHATADLLTAWILPSLLVFVLWTARDHTPGKSAISAVVLDEKTSGPPSMGQQIGRYFGYFLAVIPFGLGLIWVAFDPKKQGWHDKLAGTVVVRPRKRRRVYTVGVCQ